MVLRGALHFSAVTILSVLLGASANADDCNGNSIPDDQDIASGTSFDRNTNDIPDECEDLPTKLIIEDGEPGDYFGSAVAVDGDVLVVGAPGASDDGTGFGLAYVFSNGLGGWTLSATLTPPVGGDNCGFGTSVAIDGDIIAIGAPQDSTNGDDAGAVCVFRCSGGLWAFQQKLIPTPVDDDDEFGASVAITNGQILIGAPGDSYETYLYRGAVYVYENAGGGWTEADKLVANDFHAYADFGDSLCVSDDMALVGSPRNNENGYAAGAAYVFTRSAGIWLQSAKLLAADGTSSDRFGASTSLSGNIALVGASGDSALGYSSGSAYVFGRSSTEWRQRAKLNADDGSTGDYFGEAVALFGNAAIVGAFRANTNASGVAYTFTPEVDGWTQTDAMTPIDAESGDSFGDAVAVCATAIIVGVPKDDETGYDAGAVYVFDAPLIDCNGNGQSDAVELVAGTVTDLNANGILDGCESLGDMDCDGDVTAFDIDPFVLALVDADDYAQAYPDCNRMNADINGDGVVNAFDIDPFVVLLVSGQ